MGATGYRTQLKKKKGKTRGGVYVWRARKPGSLLGLPMSACMIGAVAACVGLHTLTGAPWFFGLVLLLFSGTHFAYVGETTSFYHRERQHLGNAGTTDEFKHAEQPWSDLRPRVVMRFALPVNGRWLWIRRLQKVWLRCVETFFIFALWPAYNDAKNRWNPRRIPREVAKRQRFARSQRTNRWSLNFRPHHALGIFISAVAILALAIF